ncbi:MAG: membrane protein insertion efficiency factor YidD [Bdellovibrionales bacterium]|nr:membrane protein insertion efficiency factor YidD [Bdellovibrionales bacterium]
MNFLRQLLQALHRAVIGILLIPIWCWQRFLSPLFGNVCRYHPSCSAYAAEALKTHGIFVGSYLALRRLLRCNALFPGGFDPVPPRKPQK